MALVSDITSVTSSGFTHIDALLAEGPGWNWLMPTRNVIYYTFSVASDNETGNASISGGVSAFNAAQQSACLSQLSYISQLTGITFAAAASEASADVHFAATNVTLSSSTSGLCSWRQSYSFDASNTVTSYAAEAYVYLDNAEWAVQNGTPTSGSAGYETLLHELGHALGLKHPFEGTPVLASAEENTANSIMSYTDSGGPHATFSPYDLAALLWIYGGDGLGGQLGVSTAGSYIVGNGSSNVITGANGSDRLDGLDGNDSLVGGSGSDQINGGTGTDTSVYSGTRASFTLSKPGANFNLTDTQGTDTLTSVERLQFSDKKLALDLSPTERAGQALEFIGLMAPTLINTPSVVGLILGFFDQGSSLHDVCQLALDVGLVSSTAGSSSNAALAAMAFRNVIGAEADPATVDMLVGYMDGRSASYSQADFMTVVAGLELNQTHINLVGLQQTGIEFI